MESVKTIGTKNIILYVTLTTLIWTAIMSVASILARDSIDIRATLIAGVVFWVILFCFTYLVSRKRKEL